MANWRLKGCPRCGGDLYASRDEYNIWYEACLQCGYVSELKQVPVRPEPAKTGQKPVEAA